MTTATLCAADLLKAAELYFNKHFELVPNTPEFELNTARGTHLLERALEEARAEKGALHEYQALAMLGIYHSNMSRLDEALAYYEKARAVVDANPDVAWAHRPAMNANNTSGVLKKMGRFEEEVRWLERSRELFEQSARPVNVLIADLYLGSAYRRIGRLDESRQAYVRGLASAVELEQRGEIPWLKWGYAETLAALGDREGARREIDRAEELFKEGGEEKQLPPLYRTLYRLARGWGDEALAARAEKLLLAGVEVVPAAAPAGGGS